MIRTLKYLPLLFPVVFMSTNSFAQTYGKNDPAAKKILDAVSANFKKFSSVQTDFTFKVEGRDGNDSRSGTLVMKGNKYHMAIGSQEYFCDGQNVYVYEKSAKEVTINRFDEKGSSITPQKLFSNFYDRDFLYRSNGNVKFSSGPANEIELTPTDKTRPFFKVLLWVRNNRVIGGKVFEKAGNRFTYMAKNTKYNVPVDERLFVFDKGKYPGTEIVDLR